MARTIDWDGKHVPEELRSLPPGKYVVAPVQDLSLSADEEDGIRAAMEAVSSGLGTSLDQVKARVLSRLNK
jgi:hypothetical protein